MIVDLIDNWKRYFSGPNWERAFDFLSGLGPDTEEGETALQGEAIFARVMSYETRSPDEAVLETHRKYIDVQTTIVAAERIDWFPREGLQIKERYNEDSDRVLYHRPRIAPVSIDVHPGTFVVQFPTDAHMPQLIVGEGPERIKKAVVKFSVDLV